jgi:two-component system NtrC family sensor kinase
MKKLSLRSIQSQLILYFVLAILVPAGITTLAGMKLIYDQVFTRAETKALSDLNSAREIYRNRLSQIENVTRLTAVRSLVADALRRNDRAFLQRDLAATLAREKLDILTICDSTGNVIVRGRQPFHAGGVSLRGDPFVSRVLRSRQRIAATGVVEGGELEREAEELAAQAAMEVIPTPKSRPRAGERESAGMMLKSAVPVLEPSGRLVGVLVGGVLLNRNYEIVDRIKEIVHEGEVYKGQEIGTATIFQGDLRISTNVKNLDGSRAISTLVSEEVNDAVLREGRRWVGEAFVVNAWYVAAYEPIRDLEGRIVGILYVGMLRQPFMDVLWNTLAMFVGVAAGGILLVVAIAVLLARRISRPLRAIEDAARQIADGDFRRDVEVRAPEEIEDLAGSINRMARKLEAERIELEEWGTTLEKRVQERTDEIKRIHGQLFRSEKLASLGKLAAGVAHEINNPLTGILANSSLLLEETEPGDPNREDLAIIVKETIRCREIVKRLLDFARQTKPQKKLTDVNQLLDAIILLVRNQASFRNIVIDRSLADGLPQILCDSDQLQQVFINIILNASEAMTGGGRLTVRTSSSTDGESVVVSFADSGPGIPEERRERIFDPFFTTKEHGTGLGLSISYGIVEQHGGNILVESEVGRGATFTVQLPVRNPEAEG